MFRPRILISASSIVRVRKAVDGDRMVFTTLLRQKYAVTVRPGTYIAVRALKKFADVSVHSDIDRCDQAMGALAMRAATLDLPVLTHMPSGAWHICEKNWESPPSIVKIAARLIAHIIRIRWTN